MWLGIGAAEAACGIVSLTEGGGSPGKASKSGVGRGEIGDAEVGVAEGGEWGDGLVMRSMIFPGFLLCVAVACVSVAGEGKGEKVRALLVTGGCCHDYEKQKVILTAGISERFEGEIEWTVLHEGGDSRDHKVSVYSKENWAEGYDIVVHNECFGAVTDVAFVEKMVEGHIGTPAVAIHCTMHSYRNAATEAWRNLLGVKSVKHEKHHPITVLRLEGEHPVMEGFPEKWETPQGELYEIVETKPTMTALASGHTTNAEKKEVCIWVNEYEGTRVFGTTLGHHNETMMEDIYLELVTRGFAWALGR